MSRGGEQIKVSDIPALIDQIETGGKATKPFEYVEYVEVGNNKYYETPAKIDYDNSNGTPKVTIKIKNGCMASFPQKITETQKDTYYSSSELIEISATRNPYAGYLIFCFGGQGNYITYGLTPDIIILAPYYGG